MGEPWVEKYRPKTSEEVCGNRISFEQVQNYQSKETHVLLYGPSGTGKSSAVRALLKTVPNDAIFNFDTKTKCASIQNILIILKNFLKRKINSSIKYVIVDEADSYSPQEQNLFVSTMQFSKNTVYIFLCNNIENITKFIIDKCELLEFHSLNYSVVKQYLWNICNLENIKIKDSTLKYIFENSNKDLRKTVSMLQYLNILHEEITTEFFSEIVYLHKENYKEKCDMWKKKDDIYELTNELYYLGYQVSTISYYVGLYCKSFISEKNMYELLLISHNARISSDCWFSMYRLLVFLKSVSNCDT